MGACCWKKEKKEIVDTPEVVVPIKMVSITKNDEKQNHFIMQPSLYGPEFNQLYELEPC
jgi:hypothetical protein